VIVSPVPVKRLRSFW